MAKAGKKEETKKSGKPIQNGNKQAHPSKKSADSKLSKPETAVVVKSRTASSEPKPAPAQARQIPNSGPASTPIQRQTDTPETASLSAPPKSENSNVVNQVSHIISEKNVSEAFDRFVREALAIDYSTLDKSQLSRLKKSFNDILKNLSSIAADVEKRHNELLMSVLVLGDLFIDALNGYCEEMLSSMNREELKSLAARLYEYRSQLNIVRDRIMTAAETREKGSRQ